MKEADEFIEALKELRDVLKDKGGRLDDAMRELGRVIDEFNSTLNPP